MFQLSGSKFVFTVPGCESPNSEPRTPNWNAEHEPGTWNPERGTRNVQPGTCNPERGIIVCSGFECALDQIGRQFRVGFSATRFHDLTNEEAECLFLPRTVLLGCFIIELDDVRNDL